MRVAIIHDHFLYFGGAERVFLAFCKMYPGADIYLGLVDKKLLRSVQSIPVEKVQFPWFNFLARVRFLREFLKPLVIWYWEQLDLTTYDLVVSSSHSFSSKSVITNPHTHHLCYLHTPPRYLYTEYNFSRWLRRPFWRMVCSPVLSFWRMHDFISAQRADVLVVPSRTVQQRVSKYYQRESTVIHPPVVVHKAQRQIKEKDKTYYLCFSRLVEQKGIELAVEVCTRMKWSLLVVGVGSELQRLQSLAGPTVHFAGFVEDEQIAEIYQGAKALLYCSKEEDFGLVPVEALAHGVPVIAFRSGGVTETVIEKKTGLFFEEYSVESLVAAIKKFEKLTISSAACRKHAAQFSEKRFTQEITDLVKKSFSL